MVELARRRVVGSNVSFRIGRFEDVELPAGSFAAAFSATAFHWIDPTIGWAKVAGLLQPSGVLALLSHTDFSPLDDQFRSAWIEVLPEAATWERRDRQTLCEGAEARRGNVSELWAWLTRLELAREEAAELFTDVRFTTVAVEQEETAEQLIAVLRTTSTYLRLDGSSRRRLESGLTAVIKQAGGGFHSTILAVLVTARVRA